MIAPSSCADARHTAISPKYYLAQPIDQIRATWLVEEHVCRAVHDDVQFIADLALRDNVPARRVDSGLTVRATSSG
jgi:hypothetical protein